jgi:hypothetical protein
MQLLQPELFLELLHLKVTFFRCQDSGLDSHLLFLSPGTFLVLLHIELCVETCDSLAGEETLCLQVINLNLQYPDCTLYFTT